MSHSYFQSLLGGVLIGTAVSLMLLLNGRVTGISGILGESLKMKKKDFAWRVFFLAGLISGGILLSLLQQNVIAEKPDTSTGKLILAAVFVGSGTLLGSGCTSGHGICGLSRFSKRSLLATALFMISGILTVAIIK